MLDVETVHDPEQLRAVCRAYESSHRILTRRIEDLARRIAEYEGLDAAQAALDLPPVRIDLRASAPVVAAPTQPAPAEPEAPSEPQPPRRGHGPKAQASLPTVVRDHHYESPPPCPACQGEMQAWEGQTEDSEQITVHETTYRLELIRRQKYRCRCNGAVVTAPGAPKLIPGGRYSLDFAVHSAIQKFCDHSVPRRHAQQPKGRRSKPCCMKDEGGPLGIGVQAQVPNHLELLGSRVRVVSVEGKGAAGLRQVRSRKTSASEPLMTCREVCT